MLDGQKEQQHLPFKIWIDLEWTTESITRVLLQTLCSSLERPHPPCLMPTISTSGSLGWWGMLGNIGIAGIRGMQQIQNCYRLWWIRCARGFTVKWTHIFPTVDRIPRRTENQEIWEVGSIQVNLHALSDLTSLVNPNLAEGSYYNPFKNLILNTSPLAAFLAISWSNFT